jgi:hypothetical protein
VAQYEILAAAEQAGEITVTGDRAAAARSHPVIGDEPARPASPGTGRASRRFTSARTVTADTIVLHAPEHRVSVPRQLPPPARTWVDRAEELERLDRLLTTADPTRVQGCARASTASAPTSHPPT